MEPTGAGARLREAVRALVLDGDDNVLLVRLTFAGVPFWTPPGGGLEPGEDRLDALARELREEVGLVVDPPAPHQAVQRVHDRWVTFVQALEVTDEVADALRARSPELSRIGWYAPDALPPLDPDARVPLQLLGVC